MEEKLFGPNRRRKKATEHDRKTNSITTVDNGNDSELENLLAPHKLVINFTKTDASHKRNQCRNHKAALNENLPSFHIYSSFISQFNKS